MPLNFIETQNPDNIHKFIEQEQPEEITLGASAVHTFEFPFLYSEVIKHMSIIYKQGTDIVLEKTIQPEWITEIINPLDEECTERTILRIPLSPLETLLFKDTLLDTFAQLFFTAVDDSVNYTHRIPITIIIPLDKERI